METKLRARVAVAGAGAIGSAVALTLARARFDVTLFDPSPAGDNASSVAAGMLAPVAEAVFDPVSTPHLALLRRARDLWPAFAQGLGLEILRDGLRIEGEAGWLATIAARFEALGAPFQRLDGALVDAEDWRIEARPALAALRAAFQTLGGRFEPRAFTPDDLPAFSAVVLATGASDACGLAPELKALSPIKGQILRADRGPATGPVIRGEGVYICPGESPAIGATMEAGRDDLIVDSSATDALRAAAIRLRPELARAVLTTEVGVRAATPDGLPLVGWSATPGVMLAVGARRNGWLLAPLVADLAASYLKDDNPGPDAASLDARRFSRT
ncbi:D-amino acid oxidase [Caulobacter sp. Root487D2Y]|uniref:NAD(P)/FAD-dependent oxidoreductase n=1 Tax=Caulobacter sp. Root487D2Y TaxID=1736547 RepID=UPI0006F9B684|nr:FAD-dependent oxidoreductase [Caulobacter sp. Root487D2Y]KQY32729.1 D-amino acid oxidase [Caulobacter sp. Root487D2Y]